MEKMGRNEQCHCGSGKKYKNCHLGIDQKKESTNKSFIIGGILLLFLIFAAIGWYWNSQSSGNSSRGNAPEGKVWSEEHGHFHDVE